MTQTWVGILQAMYIDPVPLVAIVVGLLAVLAGLYGTAPAPQRAVAPPPGDWEGLPVPADIRHASFPRRLGGYDPVAVEERLQAISAVYGDLLATLTPQQRTRAERAAERRTGRPPRGDEHGEREERVGDEPHTSALPGDPTRETTDALRLEASLSAIAADGDQEVTPAAAPAAPAAPGAHHERTGRRGR